MKDSEQLLNALNSSSEFAQKLKKNLEKSTADKIVEAIVQTANEFDYNVDADELKSKMKAAASNNVGGVVIVYSGYVVVS